MKPVEGRNLGDGRMKFSATQFTGYYDISSASLVAGQGKTRKVLIPTGGANIEECPRVRAVYFVRNDHQEFVSDSEALSSVRMIEVCSFTQDVYAERPTADFLKTREIESKPSSQMKRTLIERVFPQEQFPLIVQPVLYRSFDVLTDFPEGKRDIDYNILEKIQEAAIARMRVETHGHEVDNSGTPGYFEQGGLGSDKKERLFRGVYSGVFVEIKTRGFPFTVKLLGQNDQVKELEKMLCLDRINPAFSKTQKPWIYVTETRAYGLAIEKRSPSFVTLLASGLDLNHPGFIF